ncbi:MAG: hypothetical protein AAGE01_00010 [Pseudomonadota bacterium]
MENRKSNFGTVQSIDSHGTGPVRTGIEHSGTGDPHSINQHGTGPVRGRAAAIGRLFAVAVLAFVGWMSPATAENVSYHHQNGLSLLLTPKEVTVTWVRSDGVVALARGSVRDGYASLPIALVSVDQFGKVQQSGTNNGGGKVQQSGTNNGGNGGKVEQPSSGSDGDLGAERIVEFVKGRVELVVDDGISGVMKLTFADDVSELVFEFDRLERFVEQVDL